MPWRLGAAVSRQSSSYMSQEEYLKVRNTTPGAGASRGAVASTYCSASDILQRSVHRGSAGGLGEPRIQPALRSRRSYPNACREGAYE